MAKDGIFVRMYNVGFGDCFLVKIALAGTTSTLLFDCGSIKAAAMPMDQIVEKVLEDVKDESGKPRIDVVVATHRHKDHVSGFANSRWDGVEVKEVWMPWTEDPDDQEASRIRNAQSRLALALDSVADRVAKQSSALSTMQALRLAATRELTANALSNDAAMHMLHEGFGGKPRRRFLPTNTPADSVFQTEALPGVTIHVLGPSRDKNVIRDLDPPPGQSYLQLFDGFGPDGTIPDPFREDWWSGEDLDPTGTLLSSKDREKISEIYSDSDFNVAVALDKAVNGTSLMLMLQVRNAWLLFPGDAQWGTWQEALGNPKWKSLLEKTTFYKIGHHGSHNGTPVEFVERAIRGDSWAMASTAHMEQWPSIPKEELIEALGKKTQKIARSDQEESAPTGSFRIEPNCYIEAEIVL